MNKSTDSGYCLPGSTQSCIVPPANSRVGVALVCLHISAVVYALVGIAFLFIYPEAGLLVLIFCALLVAGVEAVASGVQKRTFWGWVAGLVLFAIYLPSFFLPLGVLGLWGLLAAGSQAEFGIPAGKAAVHYRRGRVYAEQGKLDEAIAEYTKSIQSAPQLAKAYSGRGRAYAGCGRLDEALLDLSEALQLDPQDAIAQNDRGEVHKLRGELDTAIADYSQALRIDSSDATVYLNRGHAYERNGDLDKAIADYTAAVRLKPTFAHAYLRRAQVLAQNGQNAEAEADFAKAKELGYGAE